MQLLERRSSLDENLVDGVAAGDHDAFAALYDGFAPLVYGLALRVLRNPALAEEVTQDVFAGVWASVASFDGSRGSLRAWILTIAHRRAVDVVRREQAARDRVSRAAPRSFMRPFDEVAESVVRRSQGREVSDALRSLTDLQRGAVELAYFDGLTHREVAQVLGIPLGTAKTRIRDGLKRLTREFSAATRLRADVPA